jgi:hypothetical protein
MSDISKCQDSTCPLKESCYRWWSPTSEWQAYALFKYENGCDYYWQREQEEGEGV